MTFFAHLAFVHQSALDPAGEHARAIARLWDVFLGITTVIYVLVMIALVVGLLRKREGDASRNPRSTYVIVSIAGGLTVVILFGLLIASIFTGRAIAERPKNAIGITLRGKQWWWQVEYEAAHPSNRILSANELTIPVGVPVTLHLHSSDVIHSFWVPGLHGKRDLIPGHDGSITLLAEKPGVYRGQCAEFCGVQHAKMALWVNAVSPSDYARWADAERTPARAPQTEAEIAGQQVFLRAPCPLCHAIRGTDASGSTAPDLTHLATRRSLGAGALPNTREALGGWIVDAQRAKPGCQMPSINLRPDELSALVDYLGSLR
ncbi:MAG: cytochrome c oxidase subunit II [Acidobacteria bacterium]|nr:cytochrome c oxidase subunit II [Acidobacteriota bacterium]